MELPKLPAEIRRGIEASVLRKIQIHRASSIGCKLLAVLPAESPIISRYARQTNIARVTVRPSNRIILMGQVERPAWICRIKAATGSLTMPDMKYSGCIRGERVIKGHFHPIALGAHTDKLIRK